MAARHNDASCIRTASAAATTEVPFLPMRAEHSCLPKKAPNEWSLR